MSPDNRETIEERKAQEANAVRLKAYRRYAFQRITPEFAQLLVWLRELRLGKEAR